VDNVRYMPRRLAQVVEASEWQVPAILGRKDSYGPEDLSFLRPDFKGATDVEAVPQEVLERIRKAAALAADAGGA